MLAKVSGKLHQSDLVIQIADLIHDFPGIIAGSVVHEDNLVILQLMQNLLFHVLIEEHQGIGVPVYRNDN